MKSIYKFTQIVFLLLAFRAIPEISTYETSTTASFRWHLQNIMSQYETWLKSTPDADPTPLTPVDSIIGESVYENLFIFRYRLIDEQMLGFVNNVKSRVVENINVNLVNLYISIEVNTTGELVFQGNYSGSGDLTTGRPLSGVGNWNITCSSLNQIFYFYFKISENGTISLEDRSNYYGVTVKMEVNPEQTYFEGLWDNGAGGFGPEIQNRMTTEITKRYAEMYQNHPTGTLMLRYLNETFGKSTLEDILNTQEPSTTTIEPETSTGNEVSENTSEQTRATSAETEEPVEDTTSMGFRRESVWGILILGLLTCL